VGVSSKLGRGSTFCARLPLGQPPQSDGVANGRAQPAGASESINSIAAEQSQVSPNRGAAARKKLNGKPAANPSSGKTAPTGRLKWRAFSPLRHRIWQKDLREF
jgi:hypothetical protein